WLRPLVCSTDLRSNGERSEDKEDLLQEQVVQEAHAPQGHPIQEGQGQHRRSGKTPL
ncbi:hypothetical protein HKB01_03035, partial [Vibrio parahaemolyticus]|nr:hypothetical protein [Vibrio parahaemolyticus]